MIKKGLEKLVREIPGNINLWKIQKTTILGTAQILLKVLSINNDSAHGEEKQSHELNTYTFNNKNNNYYNTKKNELDHSLLDNNV